MRYPAARLLVFSKAPVAGRVKTRLIPALGAAGAAALYVDLLEHTLEQATAGALCPVELWCAPDVHDPHFIRLRERLALTLRRQPDGDLGQRMARAFASVLDETRHAVLVGADCPELCGTDFAEALQALAQGVDVVLGPATDGGYYLIGMSAPHPALFADIPWGTSAVLERTLEACRRDGLSWHCLTERSDLDTPADLARAPLPSMAGSEMP